MQKVIFNTAGNGYWSGEDRAVSITNINLELGTIWEGETLADAFGELRVYFDTKSWDVNKHGLIYTDRLFLAELRAFLDAHDLPGKDVCYSEQGMQGDDYVSLDAGGEFYAAWMQKFGIAQEELLEMY